MVGVKTEFEGPPRRATGLEGREVGQRSPLPPPTRRGVAVGGLDGSEAEEKPRMPPRPAEGVDLLGERSESVVQGKSVDQV